MYPEDNMIVVDALNKDKYNRNITLKSTFKERVYIDGLRLPAELDGVIVFARTPTVAVLKYGDMWTFEVTIDPSVASLCCFWWFVADSCFQRHQWRTSGCWLL